jgi:GcrA cell cycle regulator
MTNPGWTAERLETVRTMWAEGHSASHIARVVGFVTRNAVIGVVHRKGWKGRAKAAAPSANMAYRPGEARRQPDQSKAAKEQRKPKALSRFGVWAAAIEPSDPVPVDGPPSNVVRLAEPGAHTCRWPLGDPAANDFGWCAKGKAEGSVYCAEHSLLAYRPGPAKPEAAARELERSLRRWI